MVCLQIWGNRRSEAAGMEAECTERAKLFEAILRKLIEDAVGP